MSSGVRQGCAPIKKEYLIDATPRETTVPDDDAAEGSNDTRGPNLGARINDDEEPPHKKQRLSGAQKKRLAKAEEKKKRTGANKGRKFARTHDEIEICYKIAHGNDCENGDKCRWSHDIKAYLDGKPNDIRFPLSTDITSSDEPFIRTPDSEDALIEPYCPEHAESGSCRQGFKCRFLRAHFDPETISLLENPEKKLSASKATTEMNPVRPGLFKDLRTRKYLTPIADAYTAELKQLGGENLDDQEHQPPAMSDDQREDTTPAHDEEYLDVPLRACEKKRLHWEGKTYLAPLTTVGNLPYRRLCATLGADITCSEMGLATSFLQGSREEWSLVRRHPSEQTFGIQLAGNKPLLLTTTAEVIAKEFGDNIDFVDLNCGCPIDMVFNNGSGSALMNSPGKLGKIIIGMSKALGSIPLTVKLRTGVKDGYNTAHKLMPRLAHEWGVGALALHGRTRQQRYTRQADWSYIAQCVRAVRDAASDDDLAPIPIYGGGDCYSSQGYWDCVDNTGVDGVMVARGALIKPWIFTEIKERREWDISSRERLELVRKYAEYGLSHFGTDTTGVNNTRRFLCEALSFQYRYIPIGLLETLPGKINDRPPAFRCRDQLETLLASPSSSDWVKISEMFLGKCPESWTFTPKHRSNASDGVESQG